MMQTSHSGIRDNHFCGTVAEYLIPRLTPGANLAVVSAYFTIYAYDALKEELERIEHMDFLFGEPKFVRSLDPTKTESKEFIIGTDGLKLANTLQQKRVARECAEWIRRKVDIRSVKQTNFLHGKLYHVRDGESEAAILGSSNFTPRGLGLQASGNNIELNLAVESSVDRAELKGWFDRLWNDSELVADVKDEVLLYLAQIYRNHAPEFVYYKTLFHIFEKFLGDARKTDADLDKTTLFDTEVWKSLFDFQKDGVKGIINKILTHNGCILADSVGLGKTYEALATIKFFELRNERVLVLCPKKLRENWTVYRLNDALNPFGADRFRYDVLSHTDLSRESGYSGDIKLETLNWGNYDLVVIDESHNFRNNSPGKRDETGEIVRRSRYQRLMEDIIASGVRTKVLLVSATPVNNDLRDIRNQIYFITAGADEAFRDSIGIQSLKETLRQAQAQFTIWAKQPAAKRDTGDLLVRLGSDFFQLLDELTIARARKHVQKYYAHELERLGGFPRRLKPLALFPDIDLKRKFLSYDKLNQEILGYKLSLFNPWKYVYPEFRPLYQTAAKDPFTQKDREEWLIGMMKVNFLKRLESSVEAFEITMGNTIAKIDSLEDKIRRFQEMKRGDSDLTGEDVAVGDADDDDLTEALQVGGKFKYKLEHLRLDDWLRELKDDRDQLHLLYLAARDVPPERDAKLAELKRLIAEKVRQPTQNRRGEPNKKLLVFTAFADTAAYLYDNLASWAQGELGVHAALVTGSGTNRTTYQPAGYESHTEFNHILTNFSPRAKQRAKVPSMPQDGEIDLLIATDCISEGQNLQDCDYLVNYDIHWNPVRIIQRFGRIDRIGSLNSAVQLVNFWPTAHLDQYISLRHRVEARMALVDIAATFEDNLLRTDELQELIKDDLKYRDRQLLQLKDEVLDIEELGEAVSLTEFTLDDFRIDLLKYLEVNRTLLDAANFGIYTVVPPHAGAKIAPGVIWCLRQSRHSPNPPSRTTEQVNPLEPYFLVYVLDDGNVRCGFAQAKQILGIYRELCIGKTTPYDELCNLFDRETSDGENMALYAQLLQKAVESIAATFRKRVAAGLQSGRGFVIPNQQAQATETSEFELVTWLVIKKTP